MASLNEQKTFNLSEWTVGIAGNQSCTGIGESRGKKFVADGLQAQTCLPVDRILVKNSRCTAKVGSYAWFRYGIVPWELTTGEGQSCKIRLAKENTRMCMEWHTGCAQNAVEILPCGFKSHHPHHMEA